MGFWFAEQFGPTVVDGKGKPALRPSTDAEWLSWLKKNKIAVRAAELADELVRKGMAPENALRSAGRRAYIERLAWNGRARRDDMRKARVLEMLALKPNGKPRLREPERIALALGVQVKTVRRLIEDFQRTVNKLVADVGVSRPKAWLLLKNLSPWATVERGIGRSKGGRKAGIVTPRRHHW